MSDADAPLAASVHDLIIRGIRFQDPIRGAMHAREGDVIDDLVKVKCIDDLHRWFLRWYGTALLTYMIDRRTLGDDDVPVEPTPW
jgi:hypothetical protein